MGLEDIEKKFRTLVDDGLSNGFTIKHYIELKELSQYENTSYDVYYKINYILDTLYQSGLLHYITNENLFYIIENASLLPLVLANNKYEGRIRMCCNNSYMFLCQFHKEKTPSLSVTDYRNLYHCFGCGSAGNVLDYLKSYENLTFKGTIQLLSQIFLYDIKEYNPRLDGLVKKYQDTIKSDLYMDLLEKGKRRLEAKNLAFNSLEFYDKKFEMIERIKKQEYDPDFEYKDPQKRIYLKMDI